MSIFKAPVDNTTASEVAAIAKHLEIMKPQEVAVLCQHGSITGKKGAKTATKPQRDKLVEALAEATGLAVHPEEPEALIEG